MIRVLRHELLRGAAGPFALVVLSVLTVLLFLQPWWAGNWNSVTQAIRFSVLYAGPVMAMAGAWTSGREHRRGTAELLTTTPRPGWQPYLVSWVALTLGALFGVVATLGVAAVFVLPIATGTSGLWVLALLVCGPIFGMHVACGMALGRLVRWRLIVLLTPVMVFALETASSNWRHAWALGLVLRPGQIADSSVSAGFSSALQALWLSVVVVVLLVVGGARRRWLALPPAALAVGLSMLITSIPDEQHVVDDPVAVQQVCTERGPKVCVPRYQEHVLAELSGLAQPMLTKLDGVPGALPELRFGQDHGNGELPVQLHDTTFTGKLQNPQLERESLAESLVGSPYGDYHHSCLATGAEDPFNPSADIAESWLLDNTGTQHLPGGTPDREWMTTYYEALAKCDANAMSGLLNP
jgi:hypothetical protein